MIFKPGLVFAVPLGDSRFAFGQLIVHRKPIFYMVGFDLCKTSAELSRSEPESAKVILAGNFFDVLLRNERWPLLGVFPSRNVPFPNFKIMISGQYYIESWDKRQKREATPAELPLLGGRIDYGPIILEDALKSHFGLGPWSAQWDPLKIENIRRVSGLL